VAIFPRAVPAFPASFPCLFPDALSAWTQLADDGWIDACAEGARGARDGAVLGGSDDVHQADGGMPDILLKAGKGLQLRDYGLVPKTERSGKLVLERMRSDVVMCRTHRIR
jgi:hypothetical protein